MRSILTLRPWAGGWKSPHHLRVPFYHWNRVDDTTSWIGLWTTRSAPALRVSRVDACGHRRPVCLVPSTAAVVVRLDDDDDDDDDAVTSFRASSHQRRLSSPSNSILSFDPLSSIPYLVSYLVLRNPHAARPNPAHPHLHPHQHHITHHLLLQRSGGQTKHRLLFPRLLFFPLFPLANWFAPPPRFCCAEPCGPLASLPNDRMRLV